MKNLYRSKLLLVSVIALTVLLVALDSFMLRYSPKLFWITLPLLLLSGGIAVGKLLQIRVNEYAYYDRVDKIIDNTTIRRCELPAPVAACQQRQAYTLVQQTRSLRFFPSE